MMKEKLELFKSQLGKTTESKESYEESLKVPEPTHTLLSGTLGYKMEDKLYLLNILNTYMITDKFYKSKEEFIVEFRNLIEKIANEDPEFVVKALIYSRCLGSGLRTITQLGAVLALPFIVKTPLAYKLFKPFNKKKGTGGMIYRPDDMKSLHILYKELGGKGVMPNSMKKGFRECIESYDTYSLLKYKNNIIDIANIVHPNPKNSTAIVEVDGEKISTLNAIMTGKNVLAETWETGLSEIGNAVKDLDLNNEEKEIKLKEGKNMIFNELLSSNKLGYLAAIRNIRNIINNDLTGDTINKLSELIKEDSKIKEAKIMPYQLVNAYLHCESEQVKGSLDYAIEKSMSNFKEAITGKVDVLLDISGSMYQYKTEAAAITAILTLG